MVVRRVLLGADQSLAQKRNVLTECDEQQTQEGDMTCGKVPDLMSDDEAQCLRVADLTPDLEHVGVDGHEASEAVAG